MYAINGTSNKQSNFFCLNRHILRIECDFFLLLRSKLKSVCVDIEEFFRNVNIYEFNQFSYSPPSCSSFVLWLYWIMRVQSKSSDSILTVWFNVQGWLWENVQLYPIRRNIFVARHNMHVSEYVMSPRKRERKINFTKHAPFFWYRHLLQ